MSSVDVLIDEVLASTPLMFVRDFLRTQRATRKEVRIGITVRDVRENLRAALTSGRIAQGELEAWLRGVEGYGHQHLYLLRLDKAVSSHPRLINTQALQAFLKREGFWGRRVKEGDPDAHTLHEANAEDRFARLVWKSNVVELERREDLDRVEELDDGTFEFHAYRRVLSRSFSRLVIRKTDGVVLALVDVPLGEEHSRVLNSIKEVAVRVLDPRRMSDIGLGPIVKALDVRALDGFGGRSKRQLALGISPTEANYRAEGGEIRFKSTRLATGYAESDAVRHVRRAMQVDKFVGQAGKFRLKFQSETRGDHDMIVSFVPSENRMYLFSRMSELELHELVDRLVEVNDG